MSFLRAKRMFFLEADGKSKATLYSGLDLARDGWRNTWVLGKNPPGGMDTKHRRREESLLRM